MTHPDIDQSEKAFLLHLEAVRQFIRILPISPDLTQQLLETERQKVQQHLFLRLSYAFFAKYPGISADQQIKISAATYLSAIAVYAVDHILDLQVSGAAIRPIYRLSHVCFLESQRLLAHLFPADSPFWSTYYERYDAHFRELDMSASMDYLDESGYKKILQHKYSLIHVVIDMLHHLTDGRYATQSDQLHELLDDFTFGYNLPNEVKGLQDDLETGVNNYAYWLLLDRLNTITYEIPNEPEELHKLLYATGLAEELLTQANSVLDDVIARSTELDLPDFALIVIMRKAKNNKRLEALETYFKELNEESVAL